MRQQDSDRLALQTAFLAGAIIALLAAAAICRADITAPDSVEAGCLAVCKSDAPATWVIYPQSYRGSYCVTDGGSSCIFASPVKGVITIIAATVNDEGGVDIAEHTLYNGEAAPEPDNVDPAPSPTPEPEPETEPETLESIIETSDVTATAADLNALSNAFATVIQSIDNGAIKTPAGARETFRAVWLRQAALTNPAVIDNLKPLIDALSDKIDNTDLQTIRRDYTEIVAALRKRAGCSSGRCNNGR